MDDSEGQLHHQLLTKCCRTPYLIHAHTGMPDVLVDENTLVDENMLLGVIKTVPEGNVARHVLQQRLGNILKTGPWAVRCLCKLFFPHTQHGDLLKMMG